MVRAKKKTNGKKHKPEMKLVEDAESRQVIFTKRRHGLFKKATELSILCGATVGVVVFSASGKCYSFGHPSIEALIDRFLAPNNPPDDVLPPAPDGGDGDGLSDIARQLCEEYSELQGSVEEEQKRKKSIEEAVEKEMGSRVMQWLSSKVQDLGQIELFEFYKELHAICGVVLGEDDKQVAAEASSSSQYH